MGLKAQVAAVIAVLAIVALAFGSLAFSNLSQTHTVMTTTTVTILSAKSPFVVEEVIIQPQEINDVCIIQLTNSTSTAYLTPVFSTVGGGGGQTATTTMETLRAVTTATVYANVTEINGGTTCTIINPHYNVMQTPSCPPCE